MAFYEHVLLARPEISRKQVEQLVEDIGGIIKTGGGSVVREEYWGLRQTAYPVKKQIKAHYVLLCLDTPSAALLELERKLRLNGDVLRFLSVRVEAHEEGPSAVMQNKSRDDNRRRRDDSVDAPRERDEVSA